MGQKFQFPQYLHLIWVLIPVFVLMITYLRWRDKTIRLNIGSHLGLKIFSGMSNMQLYFKWALFGIAVICLSIGIANPQIGIKEETVKGKGIDVMILLDVSNSMMAQDIQPNRLERSKLFISKLLDQLKNDRVGLILFAGNSFLQVPLTIDYTAIKMNLPLIDPSVISSQGTNIGDAVALSQASLGYADSKHKAIIILTDGEDHDKEAEAAIAEAKKNGIRVFAVGVGTEEGGNIPESGGDVKRDEAGNPIITKINLKMLEELASIGKGSFYQLGLQSDITEDVLTGLRQIETKEFEDFDYSNYNSYFYWFLLIALYLIFAEFVMPSVSLNKFFSRMMTILCLIFIMTDMSAQSKDDEKKRERSQIYIRKGNVAYQKKNYGEAEINYRKSLNERPTDATAKYNLSNTFYEQKKYKEARELLKDLPKTFRDRPSKAKSYHNTGNAYYKEGNMEEAIKNYENALKLNPTDMDTKFNLAMAKKQKKDQGGGGNKNQQQQNQQGDQTQKQPQQGDQKQNQDQQSNGQKSNDQPKPRQGQMTQQEAQQLLDALKNQEQNTQRKVEQQKQKPPQKRSSKDW